MNPYLEITMFTSKSTADFAMQNPFQVRSIQEETSRYQFFATFCTFLQTLWTSLWKFKQFISIQDIIKLLCHMPLHGIRIVIPTKYAKQENISIMLWGVFIWFHHRVRSCIWMSPQNGRRGYWAIYKQPGPFGRGRESCQDTIFQYSVFRGCIHHWVCERVRKIFGLDIWKKLNVLIIAWKICS